MKSWSASRTISSSSTIEMMGSFAMESRPARFSRMRYARPRGDRLMYINKAKIAERLPRTSVGLARSRLSRWNPQRGGHSHQICQRLRAELLHHVVAVHLHGHLADSDLGGRLLVHQARADQFHDLLLAAAEGFEAGAQVLCLPLPLTSLAIALECGPN